MRVNAVVFEIPRKFLKMFDRIWLWILLKWAVLRLYGCTQVGCFKALLKWAVLRLYDLDNFAGMGIQSTKKHSLETNADITDGAHYVSHRTFVPGSRQKNEEGEGKGRSFENVRKFLKSF